MISYLVITIVMKILPGRIAFVYKLETKGAEFYQDSIELTNNRQELGHSVQN